MIPCPQFGYMLAVCVGWRGGMGVGSGPALFCVEGWAGMIVRAGLCLAPQRNSLGRHSMASVSPCWLEFFHGPSNVDAPFR